MGGSTNVIMITASEEVIREIDDAITAGGWGESLVADKRHITGEIATWALAASVSLQGLSSVLTLVEKYAPSRRVTRVKLGDLEMDNPSAEDLRMVRAQAFAANREKK